MIPASQPQTTNQRNAKGLSRKWFTEQFWRWRKEYLLHLFSFHHSKNVPTHELKVGDLGLVHVHEAVRQMWKTGWVIEVIVGRDQNIRACSLKLPGGATLRRPMQLLYSVELTS